MNFCPIVSFLALGIVIAFNSAECFDLITPIVDRLLASLRKHIDPLPLPDSKTHFGLRGTIMSLPMGTIQVRNTTLHGLSNLKRMGNISTTLNYSTGIRARGEFGLSNLKVNAIIRPSTLGIIYSIGYPIPVELSAGGVDINFGLLLNSALARLQLDHLEVRFHNMKLRTRLFGLFDSSVSAISSALMRHFNGTIRHALESTLKQRINETLKSYSLKSFI